MTSSSLKPLILCGKVCLKVDLSTCGFDALGSKGVSLLRSLTQGANWEQGFSISDEPVVKVWAEKATAVLNLWYSNEFAEYELVLSTYRRSDNARAIAHIPVYTTILT